MKNAGFLIGFKKDSHYSERDMICEQRNRELSSHKSGRSGKYKGYDWRLTDSLVICEKGIFS